MRPMVMARLFAALVLALVASRAEGQKSSELPAFEVISIKPRSADTPSGNIPNAPDRFVRPNVSVSQLMEYAFEVRAFQIIGGPGWLRSDRYEVAAKAETAVPQAQMRLMVQRLLAERFGLEVHRDTRDMDTYALLTGIRVPRFASVLETMATRKIVDRTNLTGTYDIELDFLPDPGLLGLAIPNANALQQSDIPPLTTAIQDQLWLKLESERAPVDVIHIDSVRQPTAN
jgi:Protein of unknown function (DUF3738)